MSKRIALVLCSIALLLLSSNFSFAQPPANNWGIGGRISYYALDDTTIEDVKFDPDGTALFEGNLTWFAAKWISFEFAAGYAKTDVNAEAVGLSVEFGEMKQIPLLLTGRLHWWSSDSKLTLYGGGGIGYYLNDFSLASVFLTVEPGLSVEVDDSFGFHLAAGFEYFFAKDWAFNLDLKYIWNEADINTKVSGVSEPTRKLDLDGFVAGIGIKFYF